MLSRLIDSALRNRWLVVLGLVALLVAGITSLLRIPIDAFPDLTNNQVVVITEAPGLPPVEVEQLVTFPIETALMGLPRTQGIRSTSKLGLSMVTLLFEDSVNTYFARQIVNERMQEVRSRIPAGLEPSLGPIATAFGELYQYTVEGGKLSAMDRKTLHEWQIKNQLRTVPGINEVNTWGGETKEYVVEVDPAALARYNLTLHDLFARVADNNANFGGGYVEHNEEQYTVRGLGRARSMDDLANIVVLAQAGTPVLLRNVANVVERALPRQGATLRDGRGETVSGMTIMLKGENGRDVINRVKQRIASLKLPSGVQLVPYYDQSTVIDGTIHTVRKNLLEAGLLVVLVLLIFLGNFQAALIVAAMIPLSMLFGFIGMTVFGVSANLMSLGAMDFGMLVDGSVVMVENAVRHLRGSKPAERLDRVRDAANEVARPILFGVLIIVAVYVPIFTLQGLEGRMFRPMAITVCCALVGSLLLALTVVPTFATFFLKGTEEKETGWFTRVHAAYERTLRRVLPHRVLLTVAAVAVLAVALTSVFFIGTEFMPKLDEGSLLITTRKLPGISLTESVFLSRRVESTLLTFPEVQSVVTKLGRPDLATEAMGIYEADVYILLKPKDQWQTARDNAGLIDALAKKLETIPGVSYNFTQPMAMRLDEVVSGIKADVAVKIFGDDAGQLQQLAQQAEALLKTVPSASDVQSEIIAGVGELRIEIDRPMLARYGLNVTDVQELLDAAISGKQVSEMIEQNRRFPIAVRLPARYRSDWQALAELPLQAPHGERVRLDQVARLRPARGPEVVYRENAQRRIVVQANVRGTDLGSFVKAAQAKINSGLTLPPGYTIEWGGQFENQARATKRLAVVLPASLLLIAGLLFATFQSVKQALLILTNVPFALVGGIAALWLTGLNLNLSASVGFIALFGVAVLNGIVMVSYINHLRADGKPMDDAIVEGAATRLRPVLMTALVASLGFIPMALSSSQGAEVQRPLATVVIGGLITSTALTLFLLPSLYPWFTPRENASKT